MSSCRAIPSPKNRLTQIDKLRVPSTSRRSDFETVPCCVFVGSHPRPGFALSQAGNRVRGTSNHDRFPSFAYCSDHGEDAKGDQRPILNVFVRTPDGSIRHGYATELMFPPRDPGQDSRHVASVWPMGACSISRPRAPGANTHPKLSYD